MVSLVIVSHSHQVAEGVAELAREMAGGALEVVAAGGVDAPEGTIIGTDALKIARAIVQAHAAAPDRPILVVMDLGSAVLSAEMALELLEAPVRQHVTLCDAPLVEGAVVAAAQARAGAELPRILAEMRAAGSGKLSDSTHAPLSSEASPPFPPADASGAAQTARLRVPNQLGFHARPAARIAQALAGLQATVTVRNLRANTPPADARSVSRLLALGARQGDEIEVMAQGPDAAEAIARLRALAEANLGDPLEPSASPAQHTPESPLEMPAPAGALRGVAASPGVAVGRARWLPTAADAPGVSEGDGASSGSITDPQQEALRLAQALLSARQSLQQLRDQARQRVGDAAAAIFDAQLAWLEDPEFAGAIRAYVQQGSAAAVAVRRVAQLLMERLRTAEDTYTRERAVDVRDLAARVIAHLTGAVNRVDTDAPGDAVWCADEFTPSQVAQADPRAVRGLCAIRGAQTGHAAILARALGLPAVFGLGDALASVGEGELVALDGAAGWVLVAPSEDQMRQITAVQQAQASRQAAARQASHAPAVTRSGKHVEVAANIGSLGDARRAMELGADGVGLFRTEFLFLHRAEPPDEAGQVAAYRAVAEVLQGRPLTIRTLDVGGDKPLPWLRQPPEANPFLGVRGVRLCLAYPDVLRTQLRAIAQVALDHPVRVMFPMVSTVDEWRAARAIWDEVRGVAQAEVGIMVEVPAAALQAASFAPEVDFFSIGTNDLTQYVFAAERGNAALAHLQDAAHPTIQRLIGEVCEAAHRCGRWVGVCGELAGDPRHVEMLLALGVDELSVNPAAVPLVKAAVRGFAG